MYVKPQLLIVEDDRNFGLVLKEYLTLHHFEVTLATDGLSGLNMLKERAFDLCVLDVMMPGMDGFSLARHIKEYQPALPFIFLTAKSLKEDIVTGFGAGADDYILKPFDAELLLLKIKAIVNRVSVLGKKENKTVYQIGSFSFYPLLRQLSGVNEIITLSPRENELLLHLCLYLNEVMPRGEALKKIWGEENYFTARSMDVYIARLRKYLKKDRSVEIVNLHQKGFRLFVKNELSS